MELLLHEEAERSEHANAAVRELGLAVAVNLELGLAFEEAGRVEVELAAAEGVEIAGEAVREAWRLGGLRGAEAAELHLRRDLGLHRHRARERERGGDERGQHDFG